jgi:amino acid transporter
VPIRSLAVDVEADQAEQAAETARVQRGQARTYTPPEPAAADPGVELPPDGRGYRFKRKVLGKALNSEELEHQRLGKPTALAVFASDNLSSSAYATEEILHVLVPVAGVAAFSLVMPVTILILVVLAFLILSYRETIKEYPSAGGAYLVTRDNFGLFPAQIAGVALLFGYVLTVAVSVAAGAGALTSAFEDLAPYRTAIAVLFAVIVAYGNLRGVKESGKVFAVPTYFFMINMAVLLGYGLVRAMQGDLHALPPEYAEGLVDFGKPSNGLFYGAGMMVFLKAFASGGSAVTGVEAISNGVPAFQRPEWKNARDTLVMMGAGLAVMFLGLSLLTAKLHVAPFEHGTPTVISQVGELVYGGGAMGHILYYCLQAGTMLILVLAANTGYADFPRLASIQAADSFLPHQLTKRGHRLVFSNGIIALCAAAIVLVIATNASVTALIPLYAISVFVGFTLSQAGMTKHHLRLRHPGWQRGVFVNGFGGFLSASIVLIVVATRLNRAWIMIVAMPLMVAIVVRLNRQYERERKILEEDVPAAATAPILRRHVVLVFVDSLDLAAARAIQYARTLTPDELRAVHFVVDEAKAEALQHEWQRLGMARVPLDLVACPDRRLTRAAVETVARELADGDTEVSVLLPDRKYRGFWHRILHDRTADAILAEVSRLPHANVTTIPFHLDSLDDPSARLIKKPVWTAARRAERRAASAGDASDRGDERPPPTPRDDGTIPIQSVRWRDHVAVRGQVRTMRVAPLHDAPTLELLIVDDTGELSIVFLGRRELAGVRVGSRLRAEGTVGVHHNRLALLNPVYQLLP